MNDLSGKKIVVTGCASGIGAATAKFLMDRGVQVICADINAAPSIERFIHLDLMSKDSIDGFIDKLPNQLDGLANVAGLAPNVAPEKVITVNYVGPVYLTNKLVSRLSPGSGIANVSSIAGLGWHKSMEQIKDSYDLNFETVADFVKKYQIQENPGRSYFFTKEAIIVWTIRHRKTWMEKSIRMNCVSPGAVATALLEGFKQVFGERAKEDVDIVERVGSPEDIAPVIAFLLSSGSSWLRGTNIHADGGVESHYLMKEHGLRI